MGRTFAPPVRDQVPRHLTAPPPVAPSGRKRYGSRTDAKGPSVAYKDIFVVPHVGTYPLIRSMTVPVFISH